MKKETFIKKVQKELNNIKAKATPEEISKLKFKDLRHDSGSNCVYGLMTGWCDSERAKEIQKKTLVHIPMEEEETLFEAQDFKKGDDYTPLERYLFLVDEKKHKEIIQYLKGKTETIDLNVI